MTSKLGNNIIKLKRKLGIKGVYYEQRRNTKKSREENRHGDELEKAKKETALNNGYFIASLFLSLLAISCYLGITNGNVIIFSKRIDLADVLWFIIFLSSAIEYGTKYVYLKQKKRFVYYDILVTWSSWMSYVYSEIIVNVSLNNLFLTNKYEINRMSNENH